MTNDLDHYRDEMGITWGSARDVELPQLRLHIGHQSLLVGAAVAACSVIGAAGLALGGFTIWQGVALGALNFVTRGAGILVVSSLSLLAAKALWPVKASDHRGSVSALVDFGLVQSIRAIGAVRLGLAACGAAAMFGLVGAAIRYANGNPPALSPAVGVAILAGAAFALLLIGFRMRAKALKFAYLRRLLRRH